MSVPANKQSVRGPFCEYGIDYVPVFAEREKATFDVPAGQSVTLHSNPRLAEPARFEWIYFTASLRVETLIPGQTQSSLLFKVGPATRSTHFRCKVTTESGAVHLSRWFFVRVPKPEKQRKVIRTRTGFNRR